MTFESDIVLAGTIGGLLTVDQAAIDRAGTENDIAAGDYLYFYDANGNVGQVVAWAEDFGGTADYEWDTTPATNARLAARYEYDPYGTIIGPDADGDGDWRDDAGPYAAENPFRFSTKYWDAEIGCTQHNHRYYNPTLGRFLNRDPIGEEGGIHLYAYVENAPTIGIDPLGCSSDEEDRAFLERRYSARFPGQDLSVAHGVRENPHNNRQNACQALAEDAIDDVRGDLQEQDARLNKLFESDCCTRILTWTYSCSDPWWPHVLGAQLSQFAGVARDPTRDVRGGTGFDGRATWSKAWHVSIVRYSVRKVSATVKYTISWDCGRSGDYGLPPGETRTVTTDAAWYFSGGVEYSRVTDRHGSYTTGPSPDAPYAPAPTVGACRWLWGKLICPN